MDVSNEPVDLADINKEFSEENKEFIFKEEEFDDENFEAATLVARYRRVNSLESLREQLQQYSTNLKHQLYSIINRDYRDFITISTKLDGVDTRTLLLEKPLQDLRVLVSTLHDNILSSMQAIQEKLQYRLEVGTRRSFVEQFVHAMEHIEKAKQILYNTDTTITEINKVQNKRSRLLGALDKRIAKLQLSNISTLEAVNQRDDSSDKVHASNALPMMMLEKDVLTCSELERAAHCVCSAHEAIRAIDAIMKSETTPASTLNGVDLSLVTNGEPDLDEISDKLETPVTRDSNGDTGAASSTRFSPLTSRSSVLSLLNPLKNEVEATKEALIERSRCHLHRILSDVPKSVDSNYPIGESKRSESPSIGTESTEINILKRRSFAHCVRTLCTIGAAQEMEKFFRAQIIEPIIRAHLTQGRVDGRGGRGSFSGLQQALLGLINQLGKSSEGNSLTAYLQETEVIAIQEQQLNQHRKPEEIVKFVPDLIVNSIWQPVAGLLKERFVDMFSVGIPSVLSSCYRAIDHFITKLPSLLLPATPAADLGPTVSVGLFEWNALVVECIEKDFKSSITNILYSRASERLSRHPLVETFQSLWKLDLYFQLRCREVYSRIDQACLSALGIAKVNSTNEGKAVRSRETLFSEIYGNSSDNSLATVRAVVDAKGISTAATTNDLVNETIPLPQTLLPEVMGPLQSEVFQQMFSRPRDAFIMGEETFRYPIFGVFALEMRTCLHSSVLLPPLVTKFFSLSLRILKRMEAHIAYCADVYTPSFNQREDLELLRSTLVTSSTATSNIPTVAASTPVNSKNTYSTPAKSKGGATPSSTISKPGDHPNSAIKSNSSSSNAIGVLNTVEELVDICQDVLIFEKWLVGSFLTTAKTAVLLTSAMIKPPSTLQENSSTSSNPSSAVTGSINSQAAKFQASRTAIWTRITSTLESDCRRALGAVKAITGKYRMTNKPAPDTPSAYVDAILSPLRSFLTDNNFDKVSSLYSSNFTSFEAASTIELVKDSNLPHDFNTWLTNMLERVSVAYLEQVRLLIETVRQMDNALQRRSKMRQNVQPGGGSKALTDSQKIVLQIRLDLKAYENFIVHLPGRVITSDSTNLLPSLLALDFEVAEAEKQLGNDTGGSEAN